VLTCVRRGWEAARRWVRATLWSLIVLVGGTAVPSVAAADPGEFIQSISVQMTVPIAQKADFDRRFAKEWHRDDAVAYNRHPDSRVRDWYGRVVALKGAPAYAQALSIHAIMQQSLVWRSDRAIWGKRDYWATPAEALGVGFGDCEDATLLMVTAFRLLGWQPSKLRALYGFVDTPRGKLAHSVLEISFGDRRLWLDQRVRYVYDAATPPRTFKRVYAIQFGANRDTAMLAVDARRRFPSRRPAAER